jgi:hypothetical protein
VDKHIVTATIRSNEPETPLGEKLLYSARRHRILSPNSVSGTLGPERTVTRRLALRYRSQPEGDQYLRGISGARRPGHARASKNLGVVHI